jgi:hypothetical protein
MPSIATSSPRKPGATLTRKKKPKVLSNAERQKRWRDKRTARLRELEEAPALRNEISSRLGASLRNEISPRPVVSLRNAIRDAESLDDMLTRLRRVGDRLITDYEQLTIVPGLSRAQLDTIVSRVDEWRKRLKAVRHVAPGRGRL